jgi:hypothetical protein
MPLTGNDGMALRRVTSTMVIHGQRCAGLHSAAYRAGRCQPRRSDGLVVPALESEKQGAGMSADIVLQVRGISEKESAGNANCKNFPSE